ncbi:hypothetical protein IV203_001396 [Nitzschia inconspicua]|uniref:Uncharacterized protein n=1 Tax=Nitzschia inconspicua TaxID=303405 RepID=A0A9K3PQX9_9STRA|nr:hypothetical protein IV203_001396 [Nitzschia inconspicua]
MNQVSGSDQQQIQQHSSQQVLPTPPTTPSDAAAAKRQHQSQREGRISPRMREQDADLLECMHYAASQVSHYSPDGTPLLRPQDRSLPMEDVPLILMPMSSTSELLMKKEGRADSLEHRSSSGALRTTGFSSDRDITSSVRSNLLEGLSLVDASPKLRSRQTSSSAQGSNSVQHSVEGTHSHKSVHFPATEGSMLSLPSFDEDRLGTTHPIHDNMSLMPPTSPRKKEKYRRLLSGEVRAILGSEDEDDHLEGDEHGGGFQEETGYIRERPQSRLIENGQEEKEEEGETTASPVSVAQEVESAKNEQDEGLAERRRKNEAIQFAQAVGEEISINRDDLRIIEDNEKEGDSDDDDQTIEPQEIMIPSDRDQAQELIAVSSHNHHPHYQQEFDAMPSFIAEPETVVVLPSDNQVKNSGLPKHVDVRSTTPSHHHRRKSRPAWPFEQPTEVEYRLTEHLSGGVGDGTNFVYKGICANPPEITKHGIQRGNYAQLHRKAWLEVSDKYHRYGKNLRLYYRYWERLGFPTNRFFDWLDSKGEAAGEPLPNLEECPRSVLDSDTVLYITNPKITDGYALDFVVDEDGRGRLVDVDGDPVLTGPDGWIFVLRDNVLYGAPKITSISGHSKQRFHHSSFFGGKAVASAGIIITDDEGYLARLYPHSGHYRPGEAHMQRMLLFIHRKGVDLSTFEIDMQQLIHVSREKEEGKKKSKGDDESKSKEGKKAKKVDSLYLARAVDVACYLAHKADFIGKGIFDRIHKIRKADATSVTEALNLVDGGGHWKNKLDRVPELPHSGTDSSLC